ncbi:MAG: response regulator [Alphaproteobacteria bacterium]|nr:response regulator [Alphaproteobacteria bacterium]
MSLADKLGPMLPALRRYARALCGSQASGDTYVRIMLETLIAEPREWDEAATPRVAAFKLFHRVWDAIGQDLPPSPNEKGGLGAADERLAALPPMHRQALLLTALEECTHNEAADILDIPPADIKTLLAEADSEIRKLTKANVLIVEDEPVIALDISSLVEELGHRVIAVCATRDEALAAFEAERPDLVLADIKLADGSSGIDAATAMLRRFELPVIVITAFPDRLLTGRRIEPTFLITKPFQAAAVRAAISQALFFRQNAKVLD